MKANLRPDPRDCSEPEVLRAFLRQWHVPGPPSDLEEDLRGTFRRRSRRRPVTWLALAAGLALVALSQFVLVRRPAPVARPATTASPRPATPVPPEPGPVLTRPERAAVAASAARGRRVPAPSTTEPEVIVEPSQAELLARLGRELQALRPAEPATALPRIETVPAGAPEAPIPKVLAAEARSYRAEWETVAGEWPLIHRSVAGIGR
jgi:hypothetical protein